ncbi:ribonuclease HII [Pseudarthrobacter sp. J75]|uniref:ribonuclease HII n=1 Tax=unclassified Pseudarthrobacter TaxID=2647000 RepID=UPI002E80695B|nr:MULTISPECIES: ribonuclease HII [unclassified Pseudarthrobacter]MEE2524020.1 ribonuclease HII [Pseudarthrobacter sp. J47]MEE2530617.1 ribonuclease HII [Pseudarthrobacter sp. J75]MEE2568533.1 ribonuclease HII [Pseudarthrobacter sp. J64]
MSVAPTLRHEKSFRTGGARYLAGVDEVGRGALAGPVSVGIAVVDLEKQRLLKDVRDSKLLKPADRERLAPLVRKWSVASAVGHASSSEIDNLGIIAALRLAGNRALQDILGAGVVPDVVLLDGSHNWLAPPVQASLFDDDAGLAEAVPGCEAPVHTKVKADMQCLSVAAASVIAKVARDAMMLDLHSEFPDYGWDVNKGYATTGHRDVLRAAGPTPYHRVSWRLLGEDPVLESVV